MAHTLNRSGAVLAVGVAAMASQAWGQGSFALVGGSGSKVAAISADGMTIVGSSPLSGGAFAATSWPVSNPGVGANLPMTPGVTTAAAVGVSADGTAIVGMNGTFPGNTFLWRAGVGVVRLQGVSVVGGISADGTTVLGRSGTSAAFWDAVQNDGTGVAHVLGVLLSNDLGTAVAIDASRTLVAVNSVDAGNECSEGCAWTPAAGLFRLGGVGAVLSKRVAAMSLDGTTIVGSCGACDFFGGQAQAARWVGTAVEGLGMLPGYLGAQATGVSGDGSVVVGGHTLQAYTAPDSGGFIWTARTGMLRISTVAAQLGAAQSFSVGPPVGVSADGRTIVGNGNSRGWVLTLPANAFDLALLTPANGAVAMPTPVTLEWSPLLGAESYTVSVAINGGAPATYTTGATRLVLSALPYDRCQTITWGVTANTLQRSIASSPATATFQTARPGDFDGDGVVGVADIFAYVGAWFAGDPRADMNRNGLDIQDLFFFISVWFGGCV